MQSLHILDAESGDVQPGIHGRQRAIINWEVQLKSHLLLFASSVFFGFQCTYRKDNVSDVDAPILVDGAAFHDALHCHANAVH